ncbi:MAG: ribosome-associated translation inhibitor RaiA [Alphaproteobacteria bacterium]|nr:ribosome-associated translation inhibitor RaiA [Alphaproteobacteria bacterium]
MELNVHGKQMDVGDALRTHVNEKLEELNHKYFNHGTFANVTFSREGHGHKQTKVHISIKMGRNIMVVADTTELDPYVAFDAAAGKVGKQLRRYKRKLRDHHERLEKTPETELTKATDYVLAAAPEQDDEPQEMHEEPIVIAEMAVHIVSMSVSEASMRLDLSGQNAILFKNASHGGLNMVYRRPDGNIGWVDPTDRG